ncbi:hypothetical protein CLOP_g9916 [Closterium sp. NIES-67]|nr:hypothetical protein CLOP_g9916 [Closterium sp. NIES-67]
MVSSGSIYGTRPAAHSHSHSHSHPLSHSSHIPPPHAHAPLRRSRPAAEERLFGPLKAEHVLWIIGILLFYFYVWGRLFGGHSRAHSHSPAQSQAQEKAHGKAHAHAPPSPGGSPAVAHNKAAGSSAKHGARSHSPGSADSAHGGLAGEAETRGRSALEAGKLPRGKSSEGKGPPFVHQTVGTPPAGGAQGAGKEEQQQQQQQGEEEDGEYEVPYIVQRFRAGVIDWHDYVPQPALPLQSDDSLYVQVRAAYGLHLLAQAEAKVARFFAGDAFRHKRHGPLLDHSVCGVLSDPCAVHSSPSACLWDGFCAWCRSTAVCVDRATPMAAACAPHLDQRDVAPYQDRILRDAAKYVRVAAGGEIEHHVPAKQKPGPAAATTAAVTAAAAATAVDSSGRSSNGSSEPLCKFIIPGHFQFLALDYDEMYWHWLLENFVPLLADMPYARLRDMRTHFILTRSTSTRHLPFLGLLSQSCWRSLEDMEEGTCLVEETKEEHLRFKMEHPAAMATAAQLIDRTAPHFIIDRLNLSHIPAPSKPQVLLVARRRRRLLLNEDALVAATRAMGLPISVAVLEDLPLYEQIRAVRSCAILVGVHGSGLLNSMFLHPGSVLVQIVPYNATGADRFYEPQVRQAGGSYMEVRVTNRSDSVFHWHLAEDHGSKVGTAEERERFLQQGPDVQRASDVFFSFWVNQDLHVPVGEFRRVIGESAAEWERGRRQQQQQKGEKQQREDWAEEEEDEGFGGGERRVGRDSRGGGGGSS